MRLQRELLYACFLLIASTTSSCLGPTKYPLVGNYYVELSEDGDPSLRFDDPQLGPVYLKYVVATSIAKD